MERTLKAKGRSNPGYWQATISLAKGTKVHSRVYLRAVLSRMDTSLVKRLRLFKYPEGALFNIGRLRYTPPLKNHQNQILARPPNVILHVLQDR